MPIPPLNFVEPRDAVRRVRDEFGCTGEEAVQFLCDRWIEGALVPRFLGANPPDTIKHDTSLIEWFSGAIVRTLNLQHRAIMEPGERPEFTVHTERYPFAIDRRQLEAVLKAAGAVGNPPELPPTAPRRGPVPEHTAGGRVPDHLEWDGVLLLAEAVPQLWPDLAEQIHDYIRNVGRLHLSKPNPGAPGGDRIVLVIEGDGTYAKEAPRDDDREGDDDVQEGWGELQPPYKAPNPHPGEELLRRLRKLIKNGPYQLVFRRVNDFGARWEAVLTDQFVGLDDDLFDYKSSCHGSPLRQRFGQRMISDDYRQFDREAVAYTGFRRFPDVVE